MIALRAGCECFRVEEIPKYSPCGQGEHAYLLIEKTGLTTDALTHTLARAAGVKRSAIGFAGRKDKQAITRQWFSVHLPGQNDESWLQALEGPGIRILQHSRHGNKLRLGHLYGNRFRLGLDGCDEALQETCRRIDSEGLTNAYGAQRFGRQGSTLAAAICWAQGDSRGCCQHLLGPDWDFGQPLPKRGRQDLAAGVLRQLKRDADDADTALRAGGEALRKFLASAAQSAVFNAVLAARQECGTAHRLLPGDIGLRGSKPIPIDDPATGLDCLPSGPMPGPKMPQPSPQRLHEEQAWSANTGVDWSWFEAGQVLQSPGERRALVIRPLEALRLEPDDQGYWLHAVLPSGTYATTLLQELGIDSRVH
jgi:tRNA pseudouridine13 synthase